MNNVFKTMYVFMIIGLISTSSLAMEEGFKWHISKHAKQSMLERGISKEEIEAAIKKGMPHANPSDANIVVYIEKKLSDPDGLLHVILSKDVDCKGRHKVITAYRGNIKMTREVHNELKRGKKEKDRIQGRRDRAKAQREDYEKIKSKLQRDEKNIY